VAEARQLYLSRYANNKDWVDFEDFSFYRMVRRGRLLRPRLRSDGLGDCLRIYRSQPDPLADSMDEIIQHMNADHKDALVLIARNATSRDKNIFCGTAFARAT
jgi:hypothetical protein